MPRGDGGKEVWGKPRPKIKRTHHRMTEEQLTPPKNLLRRQKWWDEFGTTADVGRNKVTSDGNKLKYTNYDGILDFRRPGSRKK